MLRTNRLNKRKAFMMKLFWLAKIKKNDSRNSHKRHNIPTGYKPFFVLFNNRQKQGY